MISTRWKHVGRLVPLAILTGLSMFCFSHVGKSGVAQQSDSIRRVTFYVAPEGDDTWSGQSVLPQPEKREGPWRSLRPLEQTLKKLAEGETPYAVEIVFSAGRFEFPEPIVLESPPEAISSLEIRADTPGTVLWSSGAPIKTWIRAEEAATADSLLPAESRRHVFIANLKELGITDFGSAGGGGLELYYGNKRMKLARWPNAGFVKIVDVLGEQPVDVRGTKGDRVGKFVYEGDRPSLWINEKDPWVHGYWFWDWSDQRHPIDFIDPSRSLIAVKPPYHHYGYRKGQWWYGFNLLSELDSPGEYYVDRERGLLYFWPPDSVTNVTELLKGQPTVSLGSGILILRGAKNVSLRGFTLAHCRGTALLFENCENCTVDSCEVLLTGGWAVQIRGGRRCKVQRCHPHELGEGGVSMSGGDRPTLSPGGHIVEDTDIHDYGQIFPMYRAGVSLAGVGHFVLHNHIHHAPHQAVGFSGNNHTIAWNEIDHVCLESNDAGAIYAGRDWTMRGTVITNNYFHHIDGFEKRGCMGVYLDDMFCGTQVVANIFFQVTRAAFIGGGRDNLVENNVFIDCQPAVHVDARALGWASYHVPTTMTQRLKAMPYQSELWQKAYPQLVNILDDEPAAPKGNIIRKNIAFGGVWANIENKAWQYVTIENNLIVPSSETTRYFIDPQSENWEFRLDAPLEVSVPGFERIPFERIGPRSPLWSNEANSVRPRVRLAGYQTTQQPPTRPGPERWEPTIRKFLEADKAHPPPANAILFIGSSSIVRWDVARWFPDWVTINRGFGGSQIHEVTHYAKQIVVPYRPRVIVFYAGDNDIAGGGTPEEVRDRFVEFLKTIRGEGIDAPVIFIGIKPSLARWHLVDRMRSANRLIEHFCGTNPELNAHFLDVEKAMLSPEGKPRPELFVADGLHLSEEGYRVWVELLKPLVVRLIESTEPCTVQ